MPDRPSISAVIGLPPEDTVRAFEARDELRTTVRWSEMWHDDHARGFTVAKVAKLDLLATIRGSLDDVIRNGGTFEQWQANILPELQKAGWWGMVRDRDLTGTDDAVFVGPRRLRTIYDTNLRMSRAAGRWKRIQELKGERPFLRYTAVMDARTRPQHRIWHGTILPVDDPWWDTHFPPCGWYCRCTVRQLSQRDLDRHGWSVTKPPEEGPPRLFYRAGVAKPEAVPAGISPGFGYNPGKASMRAVADKAIQSIEAMAPLDIAAARSVLDDLVASDAFLETLTEPGAGFPVMVLDDRIRGLIEAEAHVVILSSDTYAKQLGATDRSAGHPELTVADYRRLPEIGAAPDLVFRSGDTRLILLKVADDRYLLANVKVTADRRELYLQSFRWARERDVQRLRNRDEEVVL
ncbi:minor capsid protein [Sphingomonas cannabina]|uniref:phage minor head protein n=1 Tax=Sphingomonas cannabina TaxID=2899123 RepID=UPI001F3C77D8|nr:phage minor head protein [Sphingomonas cannabina]UIJ46938.1 minor capsid protein [Sphingomonas cannabina]